jgi:hypothetical protein
VTFLLNWRLWAAACVAALALAVYVQTVRLSGCQAELRAERERVKIMGAQIEAQNAAVVALEMQGMARVAEATQAAAKARQQAAGLHGQVRSLSAAMEAAKTRPEGTQASSCPAGDAVQEVRRALAGR